MSSSPRCCCCLEEEGDEGLARFVHETEDGEDVSPLHHLPSSPPHLAHPSCIQTLLRTKQRKRHTCFVCRRRVVGYLHFTPLLSVNPWKPKVYVCGTPFDDSTHCLLPKGHLGPCSCNDRAPPTNLDTDLEWDGASMWMRTREKKKQRLESESLESTCTRTPTPLPSPPLVRESETQMEGELSPHPRNTGSGEEAPLSEGSMGPEC